MHEPLFIHVSYLGMGGTLPYLKFTFFGDWTKAQTTKAHTTIPHRQNRTVIEAHATKARTDNSAHGQLQARTNTHTDKYTHV
jgi:hypothetical protein